MKFVYSTQSGNFRKDCVYENPSYFEKLPPQGLGQYEEVIVVGHWPLVEAALDVAEIKWRSADKNDDLGADDDDTDTYDNTGSVRGASTGSNQTTRQQKGVVINDINQTGPRNEGEGDGSGASLSKTGDGLETVAREAGLTTSEHMKGTEQVVEIPGDWEGLEWPELRALAGNFSKETIIKKDQAIEAIRAELARRG